MNSTYQKVDFYSKISSLDIWEDEVMAIWVPITVYWVQCTLYEILMKLNIPFFEQYRIHSPEDQKRNKVSFIKVLVMVALQHVVQIILGIALFKGVDHAADQLKYEEAVMKYSTLVLPVVNQFTLDKQGYIIANQIGLFIQNFLVPTIQFFIAMFIVDTHQYVLHRMAHTVKFVYKYMHSHHHRLYVPYAFGALYNHPLEGFLLDSCGAALAFELTGMSPRLGMYFFTFSTLKTVTDHCGYYFPWDPLTVCFGNNVIYHDIHHQPHGIKTNFAQPFFTFWDRLLNTEYHQVIKAKAETKAKTKTAEKSQ
ncbi:hypothetical protein G6F62_006832 [Rhizopus arrhizus]|uniref:Fatty acid hydroxylase domain-containing protein n=1 Tax=Rhizopus oryzae TaxID=64495 RepID=A0A9P7BW41_RHIOR|nr:hypothetical protein G6F23_011418 [Rhizopus arrhizus]KAG0784122.1 hypothetical protein G6F22_008426 [Rhizopus arrhizus]KAG0791956.1 hypothetical protein G6F21_004702 [Rhizopus arrhizus]KAG0813228.1 hypothetical protein G6F20_005734 [Rhizopus arrhizus]KAG0832927.1 hypothetical protein G6F19_005962 [Rhizopus arrhizus]